MAKFITLTYPDEFKDRSYKERTTDRYLMHRYLEKHLGTKTACLWRIEWQERKSGTLIGEVMPHIHMLMFASGFVPYQYVNDWWKAILGIKTYVRTECRAAKDGEHAAKYVAKYVAKAESGSLVIGSYLNRCQGRTWGIIRPELVPWHDLEEVERLTPEQVVFLHRLAARKYKPLQGAGPGSFTLLGPAAREVYEYFCEVLLTDDWGGG